MESIDTENPDEVQKYYDMAIEIKKIDTERTDIP
jgi:hypothetical protein